jgi:hypothetical protein
VNQTILPFHIHGIVIWNLVYSFTELKEQRKEKKRKEKKRKEKKRKQNKTKQKICKNYNFLHFYEYYVPYNTIRQTGNTVLITHQYVWGKNER